MLVQCKNIPCSILSIICVQVLFEDKVLKHKNKIIVGKIKNSKNNKKTVGSTTLKFHYYILFYVANSIK